MTEINPATLAALNAHSVAQGAEQLSVGIGFPCGSGLVPWQTAMSLAKTVNMLARAGIPMQVHALVGSSLIHIARDVIIQNYMRDSQAFLFWIDADIVWEPHDFLRILKLSQKLGVVCGAYPLKRDPAQMVINFVDEQPAMNEYGCVEIYGAGLGFTCIPHTIVAQFVATKDVMYHNGNDRMILDAFRCDAPNHPENKRAESRGEDMAFFADLRALGHKIWLDPTISLGHVGLKEYRVNLEPLSMETSNV